MNNKEQPGLSNYFQFVLLLVMAITLKIPPQSVRDTDCEDHEGEKDV